MSIFAWTAVIFIVAFTIGAAMTLSHAERPRSRWFLALMALAWLMALAAAATHVGAAILVRSFP